MRIKKILILIIPVLILMSCNKDDDMIEPIDGNTHPFIGTWSLQENWNITVEDSLASDRTFDYTLEINADGTMVKTDLNNLRYYYWLTNTDTSAIFIMQEFPTSDGQIQVGGERFIIEKNEYNNQVWVDKLTYLSFPDSIETTTITTWTLERQ